MKGKHGQSAATRQAIQTRDGEIRRRELLAIQRHLMSIPAAASHRGRGHGKRPIPGMKTI